MSRMLIVAIDGADRNRIINKVYEDFLLDFTGQIDNHTGMHSILTTELFASFLTGSYPEEHGIYGIGHHDNKLVRNIEKWMDRIPNTERFKGYRNRIWSLLGAGSRSTYYTDLQVEPFTDFVDYESVQFPLLDATLQPMPRLEHTSLEHTVQQIWKAYKTRKMCLSDRVNRSTADLVMAHFHVVDLFQHLYVTGDLSPMMLDEVYRDVGNFLRNISDAAEDAGFTNILFMSDHGMPEGSQHNQKAYFSVNWDPGFGQKPHITDFKDEILRILPTSVQDKQGTAANQETVRRLKELGYV